MILYIKAELNKQNPIKTHNFSIKLMYTYSFELIDKVTMLIIIITIKTDNNIVNNFFILKILRRHFCRTVNNNMFVISLGKSKALFYISKHKTKVFLKFFVKDWK